MLPHQIQTADFLDILFAERNKMYGAYVLRKEYNRRLLIAITAMLLAVSLSIFFYYRYSSEEVIFEQPVFPVEPVIDISEVDFPPEKIELPPLPPQPPKEKIASVPFTTPPKIVSDDDVLPEDQPPSQDELENKRIGLIREDGIDDPAITAPPVAVSKGVIELPKQKDEGDQVYRTVEIESAYPGGMNAWRRYLVKTLNYPQDAQEDRIQGAVTVQFIVDREGRVSDVKAVSGPEVLQNEAIRVISKSGKWTPAIQNGRQVKSYKKQVIIFQLGEE